MFTIAHKWGREVSRLRTYAKEVFFGLQNLKRFFFCTKEALISSFSSV